MPRASSVGMLSSGSTSTGTPARAISSAISHASCAPARMSLSRNSRPMRSAVWMSLRRLATAISGSWPRSTGSKASRSAADADRGCIAPRLYSARRREYGGDAFDARHRNEIRRRIQSLGDVERGGDGVVLHERLAGAAHLRDFDKPHLRAAVDEAWGHPLPGGVD